MDNTTNTQKFARIILGSFLVLAGISHLTFARQEFLVQVPVWLPFNKDLVVILSGIVEISLGLAIIFWKSKRLLIGWVAAMFFVLVFPGNISQYSHQLNGFGLDTDNKRLLRLFFQPVLAIWAIWSCGSWKAWRNNKKQFRQFLQ